jgi:hypothetical protein
MSLLHTSRIAMMTLDFRCTLHWCVSHAVISRSSAHGLLVLSQTWGNQVTLQLSLEVLPSCRIFHPWVSFQIAEWKEVTRIDIRAVRSLGGMLDLAKLKNNFSRSWSMSCGLIKIHHWPCGWCNASSVQDLGKRLEELFAEVAAIEFFPGCELID